MRFFKLLLTTLFFCFSYKGFSAVFVVTSNADSGPGTLREALSLAAANGNATKDYINFNLPNLSAAGRTITIASVLPAVSSNLVIDGTTQPGVNFGLSNSKVILQPNNSTAPFNALVCIDIDGFEIYGLYIRDFLGEVMNGSSQGITTLASAIYVETSNNIQIGAPGKGNVFTNNGYILFTNPTSMKDGKSLPAFGVNNLKVYSNFFGVETDGRSLRGAVYGGLFLNYCKGTIEIGGAEVAKRNIFNNFYQSITGFFTTPDRLFQTNFLIQNNYFGYDSNGNPDNLPNLNASFIYAISFDISRFASLYEFHKTAYPYSFNIKDNKIQYPFSIDITTVSGPINFQGNKITFETSTYSSTSFVYRASIDLNSNDIVKIGGTDSGEPNSIYGTPIGAFSPKSLLIQRNSLYCVYDPRVWGPATAFNEPPLPLPEVAITQLTSSSMSGTATPLSQVELFWDDDCQYCQPLTYVATVTANTSGNWSYNGIIKTGVIASATLNGFTSLFTKAATVTSHAIQHSTCDNNDGSISVNGKDAGAYTWKNSKDEIIGTGPQIKNLPIGKYKLSAENGTCSNDYSFEIFDATPKINDVNLQITQPACQKGGAISGIFLENYNVIQDDNNAYSYKWIDISGKLISTNLTLGNAEPGTYKLLISYHDKCIQTYGPIVLKNIDGPNIDKSKIAIQSTNCGQSTGSITGITATGTGTLKFSWLNSQQQQVGTTADLFNQPPGVYKLQVTDDTQCGSIYTSNIEIPGIPDIEIDESNVVAKSPDCTHGVGSITGIKLSGQGILHYSWVNENNQKIGDNQLDLANIDPGKYRLMVTNDNGCNPVYSSTFTIFINGVYLPPDPPPIITQPTICNSNGSIKGINYFGGQYFTWKDKNNKIVGTSVDLLNVLGGDYAFTVSDSCGNSLTSKWYHLDNGPTKFPSYTSTISNTCYRLGNGSIKINTDGLVKLVRWTDSNELTLGTEKKLSNLNAGTYNLYLTDANGCENLYASYQVNEYAEYQVATYGDVRNSQCGLNTGSIGATSMTGGIPPYHYTWYDENRKQISTGESLSKIIAGIYTLNITDNGCGNVDIQYTVGDDNQAIMPPSVSNTQICSSGNAMLSVNNPEAGMTYRIYESSSASKPIDQQKSGRFNVSVGGNKIFYVSQLKGNCESSRAELRVTVGMSSLNIPNTITPNGDGINDYLKIKSIENYPDALVQVFTRYGQKVFESRGYTHPFDGTINGKNLPAGVYYYIINLKNDCDLLTGNITIIR